MLIVLATYVLIVLIPKRLVAIYRTWKASQDRLDEASEGSKKGH